MSHIVSKLRLY